MKVVYRTISILSVMLLALGTIEAQAGVYDAWSSRMKIRFAGYDRPETLTNFPILITLSTNIPGFFYSDFDSATDGADLRFTDSNLTVELNYEIERWDTNGISYVWVQAPFVSSTDDYVYAYWGCAVSAAPCTTNGSTWSEGFGSVWHLTEDQAGTGTAGIYRDSTSHTNHGSDVVSDTGKGGKVDGGQQFDGSDDNIIVRSFNGIINDNYTISFWVNPTVSHEIDGEGNGSTVGTSGQRYALGADHIGDATVGTGISVGNNGVSVYEHGGGYMPALLVWQGTLVDWTHVAVVYNNRQPSLYINGAFARTGYISGRSSTFPGSTLGGGPYGFLAGNMDEVEICSARRSADWIYASWLNQASNSTFLECSGTGPIATSLTVRANAATDITPTSATMNGTVVHTGEEENPEVYFCWGYTDGLTNSTSAWANVTFVGTNWGKDESFSTNITGLLSGSTYVYRCYVTNWSGTNWSRTAPTFTTICTPSAVNIGASRIARVSAMLSGQVSATGGETPSTWFYYWADGSDTTNTAAIGVQSGAFSNRVSGLTAGTLYHYSVFASNVAGTAWSGTNDFVTRSNMSYSWYVSSSGDNTYATNWSTAFTSIQDALSNAGSNDTIHIKGEVFNLTQQLGWSNSYVSVLGGYEGTGTPGNRDPATWPTILTRTTGAAQHRILYVSGVANGSLSGVTVTNGYANYGVNGGAAHPKSSGAGLYITGCPNFVMDDCRVLYNFGFNPSQNGGDILGGGIFMEASSVTLNNCVISSNRVDSIQTTNIQFGDGAGLALSGGTCWINNCVVVGNYAHGDWLHGQNKGGGMYLNGTAIVRNTVIQANDSVSSGAKPNGMGDGVFVAGGDIALENCLIANNHGGDAGIGLLQIGGTLRLENCTVAANQNYGIRCDGGTVGVTNCILWANGDDVFEATAGAIKLAYSIIEDGDNLNVDGCINSDPRFIDQVYFHVESPHGQYQDGYFNGGNWASGWQISPAVDSGKASSEYGNEQDPNGARINMGAYGNTAAASLSHPIAVTNRGATAIGSDSATFNATLLYMGSSNVTAWFCYGLTDGMDVFEDWAESVLVGVVPSTGAVSRAVSGLASGSEHFYTCFVSNSAGDMAWAVPSTNFTPVLSAPVVENRGVVNPAGPTATLQGEVITTGGDNPQVYVCWGATVGGTTVASWEHSAYVGYRPTGVFSADVSVAEGSTYFYTCYATNSGGTCWAEPSMPFGTYRIRYVDAGATGIGTGYSWDDAFTSIQDAFDDCISSETNIVYVKGGTYGVLSTLNCVASHVTLQGGCEGVGTPGNISASAWPTVITNASGGVTRLLTISGVTGGTIRDITFIGGNMGGSGGAISMVDSTNMVVDNCIFRGNQTAANGGAVYASGVENLTFQNSTLSGNVALNNSVTANGGAIYSTGCNGGTITNCVIERNIASSPSAGGGGVHIQGGGWTIRDSRISYNTASGSGGGINLTGAATHSIKNCVIAQNAAASGDGMAVNGPTLAVDNCTIFGNVGEGIARSGGTVIMQNSILWENGDDVNGAVTLVSCDVQDGDAGAGCISANPLFERGTYLATNSPCIDAGSDTAASFGLDGYTTLVDGTLDTAGNVDLGYHAFTGMPVATGDLYVKNTGSDSNNGTSWGQAFRTITKALTVAVDGSHVHVEAGTYSTNTMERFPLQLTRTGLQLLGTNSATTVIDASGSNQRVVNMLNNSRGRIEGVTVCGGGMPQWFYGAGAGLYIANSYGTVVSDCIISNNWAGYEGGGLYVGNAMDLVLSNTKIVNNGFDTLYRDQSRAGGGMHLYYSYGVVSNCVIRGNVSRNTVNGSSWTRTMGGGFNLEGGSWKIERTIVAENLVQGWVSDYQGNCGGGFYIMSGTHELLNCLVYGNRVTHPNRPTFADGGYITGGAIRFNSCTVSSNGVEGLRIDAGTVAITNSILWANGADLTNSATLTMAYSDVGSTAFAGGVNCLSVDPLFVDGTYFHLQSKRGNYVNGYFSGGGWAASAAYSPLLDAGNPASAYGEEPRPHGDRINMGAYGNTPVASFTSAAVGTLFVIQ